MKRPLLVTCLVLALASAALGRQAAAAPSAAATARITKEVRHELLMLPYFTVFDNLSYKVDGYNVTLIGQVTRPTLKSDAENVVKRIEGVEHVVRLRHGAMGPEVGQHREGETALRRPDLVRRRRADRDGQCLGVVVLIGGQVVADLVELALADARECQWEEHQEHVLGAEERAQRYRLTVLVLECEVRCLRPRGQH